MGCASRRIFEQIATVLNWILAKNIGLITTYHYLDDYCIVEPNFASCESALATMQAVFKCIGVPLSKDKTVGPSSSTDFF